VTPEGFHDFFVASASVGGALVGLLFVAISVAPERLLSEDAAQGHRVRATAALTAFVNALTVSLFGLVPGAMLGWAAFSVSIGGLLFVLASLLSLVRVRNEEPNALGDGSYLVALAVAMTVQLVMAVGLIGDNASVGPTRAIAVVVIVCFLIGIARSWELIGGPSIGLRGEVRRLRAARGDRQNES
jgi:hypothetical protein